MLRTISKNNVIANKEFIMWKYIILQCGCILGVCVCVVFTNSLLYNWVKFTGWFTNSYSFLPFFLISFLTSFIPSFCFFLSLSHWWNYSDSYSIILSPSSRDIIQLLISNNWNPDNQLLLFVRGAVSLVSLRDCGIHFFPLLGLSWLFALGGWCCLFLFR